MIPKNWKRFWEKIMRKQNPGVPMRTTLTLLLLVSASRRGRADHRLDGHARLKAQATFTATSSASAISWRTTGVAAKRRFSARPSRQDRRSAGLRTVLDAGTALWAGCVEVSGLTESR